MIEAGSRRKNQPAPPHVLFESLVQPDRDPARPWLAPNLLEDEIAPQVLERDEPHLVVWSSLWTRRPDARLRFDLPWDASRQGTDLRWTLFLDEGFLDEKGFLDEGGAEGGLPDASLLGHLRRRVNQLINADLRYTFGQ